MATRAEFSGSVEQCGSGDHPHVTMEAWLWSSSCEIFSGHRSMLTGPSRLVGRDCDLFFFLLLKISCRVTSARPEERGSPIPPLSVSSTRSFLKPQKAEEEAAAPCSLWLTQEDSPECWARLGPTPPHGLCGHQLLTSFSRSHFSLASLASQPFASPVLSLSAKALAGLLDLLPRFPS